MCLVFIRQSLPCQWICIHSCSPLLPQHLEQNLTLIRYKISTLSKDEWIHMQSGVVLDMRKCTDRVVGVLLKPYSWQHQIQSQLCLVQWHLSFHHTCLL